MSPTFYYILHLISLFVLAGYTFYAFAAAPDTRKRVMMITGIAGLLALVAGFGLQAKLGYKWNEGWLIGKYLCWIGVMSLAGFGYRRRGAAGVLAVVGAALILVALVMVYYVRLHR